MRTWPVLLLVCLGSAAARGESITFEKLKQTIEKKGITSIEGLLPELPKDMRSNFVEMAHSQSEQGASPQDPRILLFGNDARFVIAFNGHTSQGNYNVLETTEFVDPPGKLVLRSIRFPEKSGGKVEYSSPNPPECTRCHGTEPRHIWDNYPFWAGAYGAMDDRIAKGAELRKLLNTPALKGRGSVARAIEEKTADERLKFLPDERKAYEAFLKTAPGHGRYRHLIFPPPPKDAPNGAIGNHLTGYDHLSLAHSPNTRFGFLVNRLHAKRIHAKIQESSLKEKYGLLYVGSLLDCYLREPAKRSQFGHYSLSAKDEPKERADLVFLKKVVEHDLDKVKQEAFIAPIYLSQFKEAFDILLGVPQGRYWQNPRRDGGSTDGSATTLKSLVANLLLRDLETKIPGLKGKHSRVSLASRYGDEKSDRYGFASPELIAAVDGLGVGAVADAFLDRDGANALCAILRPALNEALERLRARKEAPPRLPPRLPEPPVHEKK